MNALLAAAGAAVVLVAVSLDLTGVLLRAAGTATPVQRRRLLQAAGIGRLGLVFIAWFVSFALLTIPVGIVGLLGIVPVVFGVRSWHARSGHEHHVEVRGWPSALFATLAMGGDDVAAFIVLFRLREGTKVWPVGLVLVAGAVALPFVVGRFARRGPAPRTVATLARCAPGAQILVGLALIAICIARSH